MNRSILTFSALLVFSSSLFAEITPRRLETDSRIQKVTYAENQVIEITAYYHIATLVQLGEDEELDPRYPFLSGDPLAWEFTAFGPRAFAIKPVMDSPSTNLTVRTTKRTYFFALKGKELPTAISSESNFAVIFDYPELRRQRMLADQLANHERGEEVTDLFIASEGPIVVSEINTEYKISGYKTIKPSSVFDHAGRTYFLFGGTTPAIYAKIDKELVVVNFKIAGKYVVVDRVSDEFELWHGKKKVTVKRKS